MYTILKKAGYIVLAAVMIAAIGIMAHYGSRTQKDVPELLSCTDPVPEPADAQEDPVPLSPAPKVIKKVTSKNTTKKVKMKKKAAKTGSRTRKKTDKKTKTKITSSKKIKTDTTVVTTTKTMTRKNSRIKTVNTKVVTTVLTTVFMLQTEAAESAVVSVKNTAATVENAAADMEKISVPALSLPEADSSGIRGLAPKADSRVLNAFEKMYGEVKLDAAVLYSGCFDAETMTITLRKPDGTLYHELGHFVEFCGGTTTAEQKIAEAYEAEKSKYTACNKGYVLQNSSEYFAESFRNYCESPEKLKEKRPKTCAAVIEAMNNITDSRVSTLLAVYGFLWRNKI